MASFITTSITSYAKDVYEVWLRPLFVGLNPINTPGVRVVTGVRGKMNLNYFAAASKVLKAYTKGWTTPAGANAYTQRTLTTYQMKAEASQDANVFKNTVLEELKGKGIDWNNLEAADPALQAIIMENFMRAVESDVYRQYWLNDTAKETISSGVYTGTADTNYNAFDGMWKLLISNATTTPTTEDHIKRVAFSNGSVAQVATVTITGTSGTANITWAGVNYLATFATDLATTALNFKTTHAAAMLVRGVTLTNSGATVILTSTIAGMPFAAPTIANVSGDLAGSVAATTANTAPAALSADEALAALKSLYETADATLRAIPSLQKAFLVSDSVYYNYLATVEGYSATYLYTSPEGRSVMMNGANVLLYRGVPVIKMGWDVHLDADFPTAYPHRIIYTEMNNLVLGIDDTNEMNAIEFWYNKDDQENRWRAQFEMGVQYIHGKLTAVAY